MTGYQAFFGNTHSLIFRLGSDARMETVGPGSAKRCGLPAFVWGIRSVFWLKSMSDHREASSSDLRVPSIRLNAKYARQYSFGSWATALLTRASSSGERKRSRVG
jgi:hypothetical protein